MRDGLKILQNYYARLSEEIIIGAKQFGLMYDGIVYGSRVAKLAVLELGNAVKLVSDESVENAKKSVASAKAQMNMTSQQIDLLESQKTAVFDLSSAKQEANEAEMAEAKKQEEQAKSNFAAQKQMEEENEKLAQKKKQREESLEKKIQEFSIKAREERFNKISDIISKESAAEQAALIVSQTQQYEAQMSSIETQLNMLDSKNEAELERINTLNAEKQALREEFDAYNADLDILQEENKIAATDADIERARRAAELEVQFSESKYTAIKGALTNLATFQNAKTKELAAVGKAAAITNATISTYEAAAKALTAAPPPWNLVLAATSTAAGLANVAQIMGVQLAVGTPYVPADMPATVHQGEIIVPRTFSEGLRAGDLALASPDVLSGAEGGGQYNVVQNFNFNGDVLADSADSIAEKLGQKTSELIAGGRMAPFPTGERM